MPMRPYHAIFLFTTLAAAACTTMTVEQRISACEATDWSTYGQNDGRLGVQSADRTDKFADCAALGHPADVAAYQAGRTVGLEAYCTVENGYDVGYAGRRYRKVCPPELETGFLQGYDQGRKERPINIYPSFGIGFGYSQFGHHGFGSRRHGRRLHRSQNVK